MGALLKLLANPFDRYRLGKVLGLTFNGKRDTYELFGYPQQITLQDYREKYDRGGIAKRIIDAYPKATWRGGVSIYEDENPKNDTQFEKEWKDIEQKFNIWSVFQRADILACMSTFSVILIGGLGNLEEELPKGKPGSLLYLSPFVGGGDSASNRGAFGGSLVGSDASVLEFDVDVHSERFGEPLYYTLRRTNIRAPELGRRVHWTRIIHIAEGCIDDNVYGVPILKSVYNLLLDLEKVTGGGSEAFWLRANQGLHINIDKDASLDPTPDANGKTELQKLQEQAELYEHQMTRMLRTRGADVNVLGSDVANFGQPVETILQQISGAIGIPTRILTGSERGELASTQDANNFDMQVQDRRTGHAGPNIVRRFVDRLIEYGYLSKPTMYEIDWPTVETLSENEKAQGANAWATTNATAGTPVYTTAEIREHWHSLEPLTTKQIEDELAAKQAAVQAVTPPQLQQPDAGTPPDTKPATEDEADIEDALKVASADQEEAMIRVLAEAIQCDATEVIEAVMGAHFDSH